MQDLSNFSTQDLIAMRSGNLSAMSTQGLQSLHSIHSSMPAAEIAASQQPDQNSQPPAQQPNAQPPAQAPEPQEGFFHKLFNPQLHMLAGLASSGRDNLNEIQNAGRDIGINKIMGKIPGIKSLERPESDQNYDYYKALGLKENTGDKAFTSLLDYAPYFAGGEGVTKIGAKALSKFPATAEGIASFTAKHPRLAKYIPEGFSNAVGGAGYGAATGDEGNRVSSALKQGAIGAALPGISAGIVDPLLRYGAKKYAQSAIPEFTAKAADKIRELLPTSEYAKRIEDKFLGASKADKENWTKAENTAKELDKNVLHRTPEERGVDEINKLGASLFDKSMGEKAIPKAKSLSEVDSRYFNQSPYHDYINKFNEKVSGLEPAMRAPYSQAVGVAENSAKMAPESFQGLMAARKNLNQNTSDYLKKEAGGNFNPKTRESKDFVKGLKSNLKNETLEANKDKVGEEAISVFKNQWEAANKSHQELQKFYKSPEKMTGVERDKAQLTVRQAFEASLPKSMGGQNIPLDPSMIGRYLPSLTPDGAQGIQGMKQLAKIMGSKKEAVEAAKAHIFRPQIENGAKTVDVAAKYGQLSPVQRKYLFGNSDEGKMLDAINRTRQAFGREPGKTIKQVGHGIAAWGVPPAIGYFGSRALGENDEDSIQHGIEALGLSRGIKYLGKKSATVPRVNRAIEFGRRGSPGTTNFGRNSNYLAQSYMNNPPQERR